MNFANGSENSDIPIPLAIDTKQLSENTIGISSLKICTDLSYSSSFSSSVLSPAIHSEESLQFSTPSPPTSSGSKRGRKPKSLSAYDSALASALISKEVLPATFSCDHSGSFISTDQLRLSNGARRLIQYIWKSFYLSALSKHPLICYLNAESVQLLDRNSSETDPSKLVKEFSFNCVYWAFSTDKLPRSMKLFTREFKTFSAKATGVFLAEVDDEAVKRIMPGTFISMLTGSLLTKNTLVEEFSSFCNNFDAQDTCQCAHATQSFLFFHPSLPLVVDARKYGNMARFIRKSCRPNAELRGIFAGFPEAKEGNVIPSKPSFSLATFNIGIFCTESIRLGIDEILLPLNEEIIHDTCAGPHDILGKECLGPVCSIDSSQLDIIQERKNKLPPQVQVPTSPPKSAIRSPTSSKRYQNTHRGKPVKKKPIINSPISPSVSTPLSREERKLQMYIESIQRLELREKKKSHR